MNLEEWVVKYQISGDALRELRLIVNPKINALADPECGAGGGKDEKSVIRQISLSTNITGGLLMRNNSGSMMDSRGIPVRFGLGNISASLNQVFKSSDLIGITPMRISETDIGRVWGVFTAVEVKRPRWRYSGKGREPAQKKFLDIIKAKGGVSLFATSELDYINAIGEFKK